MKIRGSVNIFFEHPVQLEKLREKRMQNSKTENKTVSKTIDRKSHFYPPFPLPEHDPVSFIEISTTIDIIDN